MLGTCIEHSSFISAEIAESSTNWFAIIAEFHLLGHMLFLDVPYEGVALKWPCLWRGAQIQKTELPMRRIVHDVCDIVTLRSARLAAAGIVGILKKIGRDGSGPSGTLKTLHRNSQKVAKQDFERTVVAMDGGLYEHYTQFRIYMQAAVNELLSEAAAKHLVIQLSKDGSGIGATILAACHSEFKEH